MQCDCGYLDMLLSCLLFVLNVSFYSGMNYWYVVVIVVGGRCIDNHMNWKSDIEMLQFGRTWHVLAILIRSYNC